MSCEKQDWRLPFMCEWPVPGDLYRVVVQRHTPHQGWERRERYVRADGPRQAADAALRLLPGHAVAVVSRVVDEEVF